MEREDAPGALALVEAFVNTADLDAGTDALTDPAALAAWLGDRGLLDRGAKVTARDLGRTIEVREGLRALAVANNGDDLDTAAAGRVDEAAAAAKLSVRFTPQGDAEVVALATGVAGALGRILAVVQAAQADGTWPRFKACSQHTCRWAFYDRSRNHSSRWCEMAVCGNRTKAREFRRRRSSA